MTDAAQAIKVTTDIEINWNELGRVFADEVSDKQAEFFVGFYEAVADMQLAYIGSWWQFDDNPQLRRDLADMLVELATHIRGEES